MKAMDQPHQLDLFTDSRDVMLRNDAAEALLRGDGAAAGRALAALREASPDDAALGPAQALIAALAASEAPFATAAEAALAQSALDRQLTPAAQAVLGAAQAAPWLRQRWAVLARRAAALPFQQGQSHAAPLWLRAGEWQAALDSVEAIASWRRIPLPLSWMTEATWHLRGQDAAWPLLAALAWLAPRLLAQTVRALRSATLDKLLRRFEADLEADLDTDALAWFPAWALIDQPGLAAVLELAQATQHGEPERAARSVLTLLRLERQGRHHEVIAERRQLRALHEGLFACYMRTR
jgi:hypothetical protein